MTFSRQTTGFYFYVLQANLILLSGLFLICVYPHLRIDEWLISFFYDPNVHQFTLKRNWFLEVVMHEGLKYLMIMIAVTICCLWLLSFKSHPLERYRNALFMTFLGMIVTTTAVTVLKRFSVHACQWDLSIYGGDQPLLELFESLPMGVSFGHCFPGGHASGGFSLWAFYFFFRDSNPKLAQCGLYAGAIFGFVMGWSQMMRGAHFMSHNLWSAWLVWTILLALHFIFSKRQLQRQYC